MLSKDAICKVTTHTGKGLELNNMCSWSGNVRENTKNRKDQGKIIENEIAEVETKSDEVE